MGFEDRDQDCRRAIQRYKHSTVLLITFQQTPRTPTMLIMKKGIGSTVREIFWAETRLGSSKALSTVGYLDSRRVLSVPPFLSLSGSRALARSLAQDHWRPPPCRSALEVRAGLVPELARSA